MLKSSRNTGTNKLAHFYICLSLNDRRFLGKATIFIEDLKCHFHICQDIALCSSLKTAISCCTVALKRRVMYHAHDKAAIPAINVVLLCKIYNGFHISQRTSL